MFAPLFRSGPAASQPAELTPAEERAALRRPKALPPRPVVSYEQARAHFKNPPAEYRSMPLWVWNDELDWNRLREQLASFREQGMGGVFVHPRPGLMTEYLGQEWFRLWRLSLEEGKRLGLLVNIYDENSYPSGFAGGHVPARAPDTAAQYVQAELQAPLDPGVFRRGAALAVFAVQKNDQGQPASARQIRSPSELRPNESGLVFRLRRASGNPWTGEFPYVDLTHPQTVLHFLETTYEAYRKQFGAEFGRTIRWAFCDEPLLATAGAYESAPLALPLSRYILAEFQRRNGYDLTSELPSLFWDVGDWRRVRFDYWQTLHDLWVENFIRPLFLWCDRNNLQWTGHWMEHLWPYPWISPADGSLYAYQHLPGIDMLVGARLRTEGKDPHLLFTIKQVASAAHQLGRRALCEAYGVAGWDSTLEHFKRLGDWLLVHGINFLNQHLSFATVRGARKRDHPPSFSDISAWWPYYRLHADHVARLSYLSSITQARNRLLVLVPTTSGFLWARRSGATPELEQMRADYARLNQVLADHQVDFDLGDEYLMEWFGEAKGSRLIIGEADYHLLVWPEHMINVRGQLLPLLERYLAGGGRILALGPPARYVDGRPNDAPQQLRRRYASQWQQVSALPDLLAAIRNYLPPRVILDRPLPSVGLLERFLPSGEAVLFFANSGLTTARAQVEVPGASVELWDTVTGEIRPYPAQSLAARRLQFALELAPAASALFVVRNRGAPAPAAPQPSFRPLAPSSWRIAPDSPNVLVLDYCDLRVAGRQFERIHTWEANWIVWQTHGFERPAWDNAVQFRQRIFDRNRFDAQSGFEATFRFRATDSSALRRLRLALETPELYRVRVNGTAIDFKSGERWLDPRFRATSIEHAVRTGENVVQILAQPFDVRMELENVYLLGNFSLHAADQGFHLAPPRPLDFGSWARQGYAFYANSVLYEAELDVPAGGGILRVELDDWHGSLAEVRFNAQRRAVLGWPPYVAEFAVPAGRHRLGIRVVSTPRNLFGPFHHPDRPRMRASPASWAEFPPHQPPGARYDLVDYGLMRPPRLSLAPSQ
ncbi:MAG: hypothetical protein RMK57_16135 [Bryobacterales bacterium]|nr:hypothetical protein [Bryobacterales bacterium]